MSDIRLRALEPDDIHFLYDIENNQDLWALSHLQQPFSAHLLRQYINEADKDIYDTKQFRFAIETINDKTLIGFIDLFDFDPKNKRAGIGIVIHQKYRTKGYGKAALKSTIDYAFNILYLHQLYANIAVDNSASIKLFESVGFLQSCRKKDWHFDGHGFKDEYLYQLMNT
jgi:diamine N-acetyltransferase